jgi:hypothetical protein
MGARERGREGGRERELAHRTGTHVHARTHEKGRDTEGTPGSCDYGQHRFQGATPPHPSTDKTCHNLCVHVCYTTHSYHILHTGRAARAHSITLALIPILTLAPIQNFALTRILYIHIFIYIYIHIHIYTIYILSLSVSLSIYTYICIYIYIYIYILYIYSDHQSGRMEHTLEHTLQWCVTRRIRIICGTRHSKQI